MENIEPNKDTEKKAGQPGKKKIPNKGEEKKLNSSEAGKDVEINTGGLNENKEIDLDRGGVEINPQKQQEQQQQSKRKDSGKVKRKDYSGNTPDIDEETLKYGKKARHPHLKSSNVDERNKDQ